MSIATLKDEAAKLPLEDRLELSRFLASMECDEEYLARLDARMDAMDAGKKVSVEEFWTKHLEAESEER